ncbi:extracellular solute-binding protein [Vibrio sp. B1Z05]|uniref:extracellular solute-binding protein n=1 Tax=Vibrio sp. B1Z05 TaxID=2654980 RepID=UPI00128C31CD|nr:extracellular solute-binding protein [Vibrio sp. B1Z05]MPW35816.1 extracellular solute-binding protein [Vibrio sp. B1Z05]
MKIKNQVTISALAVLCSLPVFAQSLVIYSPQAEGERGDFIAAQAKKATGIDVRFLGGGGGELHDRLIAERNNRQADVVLGLVQTGMYSLKANGLLQEYTPSWAVGLPAAYKDKDANFHMFWQTPIVIAYNADVISADEAPSSWLDLVKESYAEKFVIGGLTSQTTRTYLSGVLYQFRNGEQLNDDAWDHMRDMYDNAGALAEGTEYWRKVASGDTPIVVNWFGGILNNASANGINMAYVNPTEGTPVVAEGIGIIKGTSNLETAQTFVDWFGSADFMAAYANKFNQTPAHPAAIELSNETIKTYATMFDVQDIDWEFVTRNQNEWIENIQLDVM